MQKYINGLINLVVCLVISTIIIYALNIIAGFAGADYNFTHGEAFMVWDLNGYINKQLFKKIIFLNEKTVT